MLIEQLKEKLRYDNNKNRYIFNAKVIASLGLTPQEAYDILHPDKIKYCPICGSKTNFRNFSKGYSEACAEHKNLVAYQRSLDAIELKYGTRDPLSIKDGRKRGNALCNSPEIAQKRNETCLAKYGATTPLASFEIQSKMQEARRVMLQDPKRRNDMIRKIKESHIKHYGAFYTTTDEYKEKHRYTRHQTRLKKESGKTLTYKQYRRLVDQFTKALDVSQLPGYDKRGLCGIEGATQLDHIYSVHDGYMNDIAPHIIGSIINVGFIPWIDNTVKHDKSGMTKQELLERYGRYVG